MISDGVTGAPSIARILSPGCRPIVVRRTPVEHLLHRRRGLATGGHEDDREDDDGEDEVRRRTGPMATMRLQIACRQYASSERLSPTLLHVARSMPFEDRSRRPPPRRSSSSTRACVAVLGRQRALETLRRTDELGRVADARRRRTRRRRTAVAASCRGSSRSRRAGSPGTRSRCRCAAPSRAAGRSRSRSRAGACRRRARRRSGPTSWMKIRSARPRIATRMLMRRASAPSAKRARLGVGSTSSSTSSGGAHVQGLERGGHDLGDVEESESAPRGTPRRRPRSPR